MYIWKDKMFDDEFMNWMIVDPKIWGIGDDKNMCDKKNQINNIEKKTGWSDEQVKQFFNGMKNSINEYKKANLNSCLEFINKFVDEKKQNKDITMGEFTSKYKELVERANNDVKVYNKKLTELQNVQRLIDELSNYIDINIEKIIDLKFLPQYNYNQIIKDRWGFLWKKREELFWIKKVNDHKYSIVNIINEYLNGNIPKEIISKIYNELIKKYNSNDIEFSSNNNINEKKYKEKETKKNIKKRKMQKDDIFKFNPKDIKYNSKEYTIVEDEDTGDIIPELLDYSYHIENTDKEYNEEYNKNDYNDIKALEGFDNNNFDKIANEEIKIIEEEEDNLFL